MWEDFEFETWPDEAKYKVENRKLLLRAGIEFSIIPAYENSFNIEIRINLTEI